MPGTQKLTAKFHFRAVSYPKWGVYYRVILDQKKSMD
jgi:hypothetical protein